MVVNSSSFDFKWLNRRLSSKEMRKMPKRFVAQKGCQENNYSLSPFFMP